jgi:hypothetical protein
MTESKYTSKDMLSDFLIEIKRWKSMMTHMEKEALFIDRQLNPSDYDMKTIYLLERLAAFRRQTLNKKKALTTFKEEISVHENELTRVLQVKNILFDIGYYEGHDSLKTRFEKFCKEFKEHKTKVLYYTTNK